MERLTGLRQLIIEPTHYGQINTTLDLIFTNSAHISKSGTIDFNISDHKCIYVTRKKKKCIHNKVSFKGRSYKNYNKESFQTKLQTESWDQFFQSDDPEFCWRILIDIISKHIDLMCPIIDMRVREKSDPWITNELIELIQDKDKALARAKRSNNTDDWALARSLRNLTKSYIKKAKSDFIKENFTHFGNDTKKFWHTINEIIPGKLKCRKISLVNYDENKPIDEHSTANFINNYFASIGPLLDRKFKATWDYQGISTNAQLHDIKVDEEEVIKLCQEINITKSSAINQISSRILRYAFVALPSQLTNLFNISLTTGIFPTQWKTATVIPLPKEGDPLRC